MSQRQERFTHVTCIPAGLLLSAAILLLVVCILSTTSAPVLSQGGPTPTPWPALQQNGDGLPPLPPAWPVPTPSPAAPTSLASTTLPPLLQAVRPSVHPLATGFSISVLSYTSEESPAIDGSKVIWYDDRTHGPTDVWGYDLAAGQEFQVTSHSAAQFIADIGGDIVAYEDNRDGTWDICATRLSTGEEFAVATGPHHQRYPRVWGDYIVYQDETDDYWQSDVYLYQISTGATTSLAVAANFQGDPDIDDGWVVWRDNRDGAWQVRAYRLSDSTYHILEPGSCWGELRSPRIGGGLVVWQNACGGWPDPGYDIYGYDLESNTLVTIFSGPGQQERPAASDTLVAWQDEDTYGNWNVFVYVRAGGTLFPATLEPGLQQKPAVYGNTVVWQDNRNHNWDIYGLTWDGTAPPGITPPLQNPRGLHVGAYPGGEIRLSWTDSVTNELGFVIQRVDGIFSTQWRDLVTLPANTTSYTDTSVTLGESYWYRVRAYNGAGDSSYTNESYSTAFQDVPNLDERYMHVLINEARMDPGRWGYPGLTPVDPMGWDPNLAYSARTHAVGLDNSGCCQGHVDLAGRGPSERAYDSGYPYGVGENLFGAVSGREGMESAHQGFMNSEGHRNNIMAAGSKHTAIGFSPRGGGSWSLVEVFSGGLDGAIVPALPSGIVVPYTDTVDTAFDYLVSFWNEDLQAPTSATVVIDGTPRAMILRSGQPGRGTYAYSTTLPLGDHDYYFEFKWGSPQKMARLPESGAFDGPFVRSYMPDLQPDGPGSSRLAAGHQGRISTYVRNNGELAAENIAVRFYLGDPRRGGAQIGETQAIGRIEPGEGESVEVTWQPAAAGIYTVYAWVDPDDTITEFDEINNLVRNDLLVREADITWYVDGSVPASGNGRSPETAFKTIDEALPYAYPGDEVLVAAGTYYERFSVPEGVTLLGWDAESTIIDGGGSDGSVVHLSPGSTIEGFTITGSGSGYFDSGIWHSEGQVTVRNNRFIGNSVGLFSWCFDPDCAAVVIIENNVFADNTRVGVDANGEPVHRIVNNTVAGNGRGLVLNNAASLAENNIIVHNVGDGLASSAGPTVRYNDVWGNGSDYSGLTPGVGSISAGPLFLDEAGGDYRLGSGSPARDAGNPDPGYNDPDGTRNDMGAYGGPWSSVRSFEVYLPVVMKAGQ